MGTTETRIGGNAMSQSIIIRPNQEAPNYFHLSGCLTHKTCMQFVHEINKDLNPFVDTVTLNFLCLDALDGSGIGVLVTLAICLQYQRKRLIIVAPKERQPEEMIKHLGLLQLLGVK